MDLGAAKDCVERACCSSWWDWLGSLRPFLWRWPQSCWKSSRDGRKNYVKGELPNDLSPPLPPNKEFLEQVKKKLNKVKDREYVRMGVDVKSLTHYFPVPKGTDDIRMVYDASRSGLNDAVWAPWFPMPTADSHLRAVEEGTFMADYDVGEMFLIFMMNPEIRPYAGVDLSILAKDVGRRKHLDHRDWCERMMMGYRPSPYLVMKDMLVVEQIFRGDKDDARNMLRWRKVVLNIHGLEMYNTNIPWVYKVREDWKIASDVFWYIDDGRSTTPSEGEC